MRLEFRAMEMGIQKNIIVTKSYAALLRASTIETHDRARTTSWWVCKAELCASTEETHFGAPY